MMKVLVTIGAIILLVLITLPWSRDYFKQSRNNANNAFRDRVSIEQKIAAAKEELGKAQAYVTEQYAKAIGGKRMLAEQEAALDGKKGELGVKQPIFLRASEWIEKYKPGDTLSLGPQTFSYAEVCTDASNRANAIKDLKATVKILSQGSDRLRNTINDSEANAKEALRQIAKREGELQAQEIALRTWEIIQANEAVCKGIAFNGKMPFNTRHLQAIDEAMDKMKASIETSAWVKTNSGGIPYEGPQPSNQNELENIKATRQMITGVVPTPEATSEPMSPAEAASEALSQLPESALKQPASKPAIATPAATPVH
ncbi:MAG: hypothetical protein WC610_00470 [Patescibacteria group bacterium]